MITPASDGPISRATFTIDEFSAMALLRSSRCSTISTTKACRAGMSKALISPWKALSQTMSHTVMRPASASAASANDCSMARTCVTTSTRCRFQPVHPDAGKRRQQEGRNLPREADHAEQQRRTGQPVHQPAGGDARHPGADQRHALPAEKQAVVAVAQRAQREAPIVRRGFSLVHARWRLDVRWHLLHKMPEEPAKSALKSSVELPVL